MNIGLSKTQLEDFISVIKQEVSLKSAEKATEILNGLLGIKALTHQENSIQILKNDKKPLKASSNYFTGNATVESRFSSKPGNYYQGAIVNFEAGSRTAWHSHPLGQTLIVISGRGLVQSEGKGIQEILPGDVVWIKPNVKHWHGAAQNSSMSHVAISAPLNETTVQWSEHVSDEEYGK